MLELDEVLGLDEALELEELPELEELLELDNTLEVDDALEPGDVLGVDDVLEPRDAPGVDDALDPGEVLGVDDALEVDDCFGLVEEPTVLPPELLELESHPTSAVIDIGVTTVGATTRVNARQPTFLRIIPPRDLASIKARIRRQGRIVEGPPSGSMCGSRHRPRRDRSYRTGRRSTSHKRR